jgi:hypothetical protein
MLIRLLEILFFIIVILSLIRMIVRMLLPFLFQRVVNKAQQHANQSQRQYNRKPEGSINVDYIPPQKGTTPIDKAGDFIDYEEIK